MIVEAPKTPLEKAIVGFVKSYATPSITIGKIPKWTSGICPIALGLSGEQNLGVTTLLKQIASEVGAPVETKEPCTANVTIVFTRTPQDVLDDIAKNHEDLLGYHDVAQIKQIATMNHPVQAWYATSTRDNNGTLRSDHAQQNPACDTVDNTMMYKQNGTGAMKVNMNSGGLTVDTTGFMAYAQQKAQYCNGKYVTGNRLSDGLRSEFNGVTIIVDVNKLDGLTITPVANYIAMLALSQTETFETCQPLASITNLMTPVCDAALKPNALSVGDIAYLKALYHTNPDAILLGQQSSIAHQMEAELGGH